MALWLPRCSLASALQRIPVVRAQEGALEPATSCTSATPDYNQRAGEAAPSERQSEQHGAPSRAELAGQPVGAPSSLDDDESVLMRPSQIPFLRTIKEHKPVRVVTPKRHLLKQNNTISETGLQIVKMTCRDSSTKGALLSVADPAAWAMLSPPRKKTAPDYERWRNRLDFQAAYEPDLSATSHLVSPSEPALSPSMSEISDCTFDGYSSPIASPVLRRRVAAASHLIRGRHQPQVDARRIDCVCAAQSAGTAAATVAKTACQAPPASCPAGLAGR